LAKSHVSALAACGTHAELGLTEDQFKAMSPADQQKIEDKIRDLIKKQLDSNSNKPTGMITDKSV
jgi:hypothetical protein